MAFTGYFDPGSKLLRTPCYVISLDRLRENGAILRDVSERSGAKILLAQKAFSTYPAYPALAEYLDGTTASGLYEAKLGYEYFRRADGSGSPETHVFSPYYRPDEFDELLSYVSHISFNSPSQLEKFAGKAIDRGVSPGLRLNPEFSTQSHGIYDPCGEFSRLGTTFERLEENRSAVERLARGFHMHTLCEQPAEDLIRTWFHAKARFREYFELLRRPGAWLNLGGGHHITKPGYDVEALISLVRGIKGEYGCEVYLEPGEAVALDCGWLVSEVGDIARNGMDIAVIDASAACHMPDVIEMPYLPPLEGAISPDGSFNRTVDDGESAVKYRLGGPTCLAGDIIGDYRFERPLNIGDRLIFGDMAIYTTVKNNTFNGMRLPDIYLAEHGNIVRHKSFGYDDFKERL